MGQMYVIRDYCLRVIISNSIFQTRNIVFVAERQAHKFRLTEILDFWNFATALVSIATDHVPKLAEAAQHNPTFQARFFPEAKKAKPELPRWYVQDAPKSANPQPQPSELAPGATSHGTIGAGKAQGKSAGSSRRVPV